MAVWGEFQGKPRIQARNHKFDSFAKECTSVEVVLLGLGCSDMLRMVLRFFGTISSFWHAGAGW